MLLTPAVPTITSVAATCASSGTSTIANYSALNTYTFSPAGTVSVGVGGIINGMAIGTSYTVTSGNATCTSVASATFNNAAMLATPAIPTITSVAATCSAAGTSTISNYVVTGVTYTFTPTGPSIGAGGLVTGMVVGTNYTVMAGISSCSSAASATFSNAVMLTAPATPTITSVAPTCIANGTSTIANYVSTNTYTFTPAGTVTVGAGGLISGMAVGTSYTVTAGNATCTSAASASFSNAAMLPTPAVPTITSVAATCSAAGTSTISNYVATGVTYTFTPTGPSIGAGGLVTGMVVGTSYTVMAGIGSCSSAASATFSNAVMLTAPATPTITSVAPTCTTNGTSTIANYVSTNTYTFTPAGTVTVGAGGLISGMAVGTSYTVTAGNATCTSAASASFSNAAMLPTPAVPTITSVAATCIVAGSSTISNYISGSTYTFTPTTGSPTVGASGIISGMVLGTDYTVTSGIGSCTSAASAMFRNVQVVPFNLVISNPPLSSSVDITSISLRVGSILPVGTVITYHTDAAGAIPLANPNAVTIPNTYYIKALTPNGCSQIKPIIVAVVSSPCPNEIILRNPIDNINGTVTKKAVVLVNASNKLSSISIVNYQAGGSVVLNPGFETVSGTVFKAEIKGCND